MTQRTTALGKAAIPCRSIHTWMAKDAALPAKELALGSMNLVGPLIARIVMEEVISVSNSAGALDRILEELESRRDGNREKAEKYDAEDQEKREWFKGIETGYNGAMEVIREEFDNE